MPLVWPFFTLFVACLVSGFLFSGFLVMPDLVLAGLMTYLRGSCGHSVEIKMRSYLPQEVDSSLTATPKDIGEMSNFSTLGDR